MKKSLSFLLAIALVFGLFASMASAATLTPADAGAKLKELGVLKGNDNGDLLTDTIWKRQDIVVLLSRLLGKESAAEATAKSHPFTDVPAGYYNGFISWAYDNHFIEGKSEKIFGYDAQLKVQEFAAIVLRALGIDTTGDNYAKVPELAVQQGLFPAGTDFTAKATRGDTYVSIIAALDAPVGNTGKSLGEILGLPGYVNVTPQYSDLKAVGASKLQVTFSAKASAATFTVKKGATNVAVSKSSFDEAGKVATIETTSKLTAGTYTVIVGGIEGLTVTSKDVTVTDETFTKIELSGGEVLPKMAAATIGFKALNQYGEDMKIAPNSGSLSWIYSSALLHNANTADKAAVDTSENALTVGTSVTVTVVATNGVQASKVFKIGDAPVLTTVSLTKIEFLEKDAVRLSAGQDAKVLYEVKDQYGNVITDFATLSNGTTGVRLVHNAGINVTASWVNDGGTGWIKLHADNAIVADVNGVLTAVVGGGGSSSIAFQAYRLGTIDSVTLTAPTAVVAKNDTNYTLGIEAKNQFGDVLTAKQIETILTADNTALKFFSAAAFAVGTPEFVNDNGTAKVKVPQAGGTGNVTITAVTATAKTANVSFTVQAARYASKVTFGDISATKLLSLVASHGSAKAALKLEDQYGAEYKANDPDHKVKLSVSKVSGDDNGVTTTPAAGLIRTDLAVANGIVIDAANNVAGKYTVTVAVVNAAETETLSTASQDFTVTKGAADTDPLTYGLEEIPTLYKGGLVGNEYAKEIKVTAKDASGVKVAVPSATISQVITSDATIADVNLAANVAKVWGKAKGTAIVNVVVITPTGTKALPITITVSDDALAAESIAGKVGSDVKTEATIVAGTNVDLIGSNLLKFVITDQFGGTSLSTKQNITIVVTNKAGAVTVVPITDVLDDDDNVIDTTKQFKFIGAAGDTYTVTALTGSKQTTVTVTLSAAPH